VCVGCGRPVLEGAAGEEVVVVVVVGREDEDSEEEPADEAGEVVRAGGPQRHGHGRRRRPGGGDDDPRVRVRVVRGAEATAAAGPCTHLTLTTPARGLYVAAAAAGSRDPARNCVVVVVGRGTHQTPAEKAELKLRHCRPQQMRMMR